jgi:hypothetical protein
LQDEEPEVYYSKLVEELKRTFALAREAQLKTAMRNEDRVSESKFKPDFSPGDEVYVWKKSSKESKLEEETGKLAETSRKIGRRTTQPAEGAYRPSSSISGTTQAPSSDGKATCTASSRRKAKKSESTSTG